MDDAVLQQNISEDLDGLDLELEEQLLMEQIMLTKWYACI